MALPAFATSLDFLITVLKSPTIIASSIFDVCELIIRIRELVGLDFCIKGVLSSLPKALLHCQPWIVNPLVATNTKKTAIQIRLTFFT